MADKAESHLHTISSSLQPSLSSKTQLAPADLARRVTTISSSLARLAIHYYRPDFNEQHARLLIQDFVADFHDLEVADVETAIGSYRRDGRNKFFPTSGQLRDLAVAAAKDRSVMSRPLRALPDSRPICWWLLPIWKSHWRESEIPEDEMQSFLRLKADDVAREVIKALRGFYDDQNAN